ncbi:hypothetical protein [Methylopila sp. 73B]|uniref:hypothetical protein n=1 Tax=Methylopila sp. 73B TaxID=1120792 RepID=UPI00036CBA8C|nr:hypothetical protein [Methylopila sp. 73B]
MSAAPVQLFEALRTMIDLAEADRWPTEHVLDLLHRMGRPIRVDQSIEQLPAGSLACRPSSSNETA